MSYQYRAVKTSPTSAQESARLELETKKLVTRIETAKRDRDRLRAVLADVRETTKTTKQVIDRARRSHSIAVEQANREAAAIMLDAEREADSIRERAHRQSWALRDRAYTDGAERRHDMAIARTTVLTQRRTH